MLRGRKRRPKKTHSEEDLKHLSLSLKVSQAQMNSIPVFRMLAIAYCECFKSKKGIPKNKILLQSLNKFSFLVQTPNFIKFVSFLIR